MYRELQGRTPDLDKRVGANVFVSLFFVLTAKYRCDACPGLATRAVGLLAQVPGHASPVPHAVCRGCDADLQSSAARCTAGPGAPSAGVRRVHFMQG